MLCPYCDSELNEGSVYCPKCGREVQMISAVDDLEEEILREFINEDDSAAHHRETEPVSSGEAKKKTGRSGNKKKKRRNRILILLIILAAAVVVVFGSVRFYQYHSSAYLLRKAQQEYDQRDYDSALLYLDRLLALDGEDREALLLAGKTYAAIPDYPSAEDAFWQMIELDPADREAYAELLEVYYEQGKRQEILDLKEQVTDEEILLLFDDFIPPSPEIKLEGGLYDDSLRVEIRSPKKGLTIYYTLDGTVPTKEDALYSAPVELSDEGRFILTAVCMNADGDYSEPVSEVYQIDFAQPDMPVAVPDGGQYDYPVSVTVNVPYGTSVYYTWDGSEPGPDSYRYDGPITIPEGNHILSLIAVDSRGKCSDVMKCNFIYYPETTPQTIEEPYNETEEETEAITGEDPEEPALEEEPDANSDSVSEQPADTEGEEATDEDLLP